MARSAVDEHRYTGHATDVPLQAIPNDKAQRIVGGVPGRHGRIDLSPLLKRLPGSLPAGATQILGTAVWQSEAGAADRLLVYTDSGLFSTMLYQVYKRDDREDGPHSYLDLGSWTTVLAGSGITGWMRSVQFNRELVLSLNGGLYRYYVTVDGVGVEVFYDLGLMTPSAPSLMWNEGGDLLQGVPYYYEVTLSDELGRESSPSASVSITLNQNNEHPTATAVTITQGAYTNTGGVTYWNIYRKNSGSSTFNLVTTLPIGTTTYVDTFGDTVINSGDSAPLPGENDPPKTVIQPIRGEASVLCVWKDRLVMNDDNDPSIVQVSNASSITQFSSLPLPTNLADGLRFNVYGHGQNTVTGLESLGSMLAIFGRESTCLFYGDDISTFTERPTLERGCQNAQSVQRCENVVLFLSDDGLYSIGYEDGYAVNKVSSLVDDAFRGWTGTRDPKDPADAALPASVQVSNALTGALTSFYVGGRYYLSFGDKTLCCDVQGGGGFTDTGWGFVKSALPWLSQASAVYVSAPETLFLTIGSQTSDANTLYYFTEADTPGDPDAPALEDIPPLRIVMRPFDTSGKPLAHLKRARLLSIYASTPGVTLPVGTDIGTVKWFVDGHQVGDKVGTSPLSAHICWKHAGALCEAAAPIATGHLIWAELEFRVRSLQVTSLVVELSYLD